MVAVVEARGLCQRYGRRSVFDGLNVRIGSGVTAILGPNGAGKTTLLHTLVGLRRPTTGTLSVAGADLSRSRGRRELAGKLGFLPQTVGFLPSYRVWDYVAFAAWMKKVPAAELGNRVETAIERVELTDRTKSKMSTLSGGMLRRAGVAQAIVAEPELLVFDEPVAGLDPEQRIELRRLIRHLAEDASVIVSTHAVEDVRHMADHVLVLDGGGVVFSGSVEELETRADSHSDGDTDLERGYVTVLRRGSNGVST